MQVREKQEHARSRYRTGETAIIKPNFFILGAPKCGTRALYEYLVTHPNIFMPAKKEINYFSDDVLARPNHLSEQQYLAMFQSAGPEHAVVGESSVHQLYSPLAVSRILEFNPRARMIAMVRNPIEMVYSYHHQMLWNTIEDVEDFEEAWRLRDARREHRCLPARLRSDEPRIGHLQYSDICALGTQLERLFASAPRDHFKVIVFDDFVRDTQGVYDDVLAFLEIPSDRRTSFPKLNGNKTFTSGWARRAKALATSLPRPIRLGVDAFKRVTGLRDLGLQRRVLRVLNRQTKPAKRAELAPAFRRELREHFRPQIAKLEELLQRDFSHWQ